MKTNTEKPIYDLPKNREARIRLENLDLLTVDLLSVYDEWIHADNQLIPKEKVEKITTLPKEEEEEK